jgi:hypothetical protein
MYGLFHYAANSSAYILSSDWMNELERMWKEAVVSKLEAFVWRGWIRPQKTWICLDGLGVEAWTWDLPNMKHKRSTWYSTH